MTQALEMRSLLGSLIVGSFLLLASGMPVRAASSLITNGGFESGSFTGWTVTNWGSGAWFVDSDTSPPLNGADIPTVGPAAGTYYAVTDQEGPTTAALRQTFTVPSDAVSLILSFQMFVDNYGSFTVGSNGLDHTSIPNQHARVDLLTAAATAFDTGSGVLANFYIGSDSGEKPHSYKSYQFEISPFVVPGGTYQLRFAETDNQGILLQGVDNISIVPVVPEPETYALFLAGLGFVLARARLRKRQPVECGRERRTN
jgi:hypothetical protein